MMNVRNLRAPSDDAGADGSTTLVMSSRPPRQPASAVVPVARDASAKPRLVDVSRAQPSTFGETTQISRTRAAEITRYRRLSLALAIALAFALGLSASLAARLAWEPTVIAARAPRDGVTRAESLDLFDGVDAKRSTPKQPKPRAGRARPEAASNPTREPDTDADDVDLRDRDLLGEGLSPSSD